MNKMLTAAFAFSCAAMLSSAGAFAGECSNASIKGHYTYWLQGQDANGKMYAEAGQEHFDGAGNVKTITGVAGVAKSEEDTGTYTVNGDCTGEITYASGSHDKIYVAPSGDSFVFSSAKEGLVQVGEDTRVDAN
jgi:hypothetical protein